MNKEQAESIALQALSFIVKDNELLDQFLTNSGLTPQELKGRVNEPELLGGVLDTLLINDEVLLAFCNSASLSPNTIMVARQSLPGAFVDN